MNTTTQVPQIEPEIEVSSKATRRRFTAEYKRRFLKEAECCIRPGEMGTLLQREGLYSSHLTTWRAQQRTPSGAGPGAHLASGPEIFGAANDPRGLA